MKAILVSALFVMSANAFAQDVVAGINAKILPGAKVVGVHCQYLSHLTHDWSAAGEVQIVTSEGQKISMTMVVSRYENEQKEATDLCNAMENLKTSGETTDVIYTEETDFDGSLRFDIKGGSNLSGLNSLNNG